MFSFFQGLNKKSVKIILFKINIITLYNKLHIFIYIYFKISEFFVPPYGFILF